MAYYQKRRPTTLIDSRFEGRSIELYTIDGERIVGKVDEVSTNELGLVVEGEAVVIPRRAILYIVTGLSDIHGHGECCESEYVIDEDFIGSDVVVKLMNGQELSGRVLKITRDEIGIAQGNRAMIIPRNAFIYVKIARH